MWPPWGPLLATSGVTRFDSSHAPLGLLWATLGADFGWLSDVLALPGIRRSVGRTLVPLAWADSGHVVGDGRPRTIGDSSRAVGFSTHGFVLEVNLLCGSRSRAPCDTSQDEPLHMSRATDRTPTMDHGL